MKRYAPPSIPHPANHTQRLKSALWYSIGHIVDEESLKLGVNATPQFIGALTELVWAQVQSAGGDLEAFAKHAGRSKIRMEDVMLLVRRNEDLAGILRGSAEGGGDRG